MGVPDISLCSPFSPLWNFRRVKKTDSRLLHVVKTQKYTALLCDLPLSCMCCRLPFSFILRVGLWSSKNARVHVILSNFSADVGRPAPCLNLYCSRSRLLRALHIRYREHIYTVIHGDIRYDVHVFLCNAGMQEYMMCMHTI